MKGRRRTCCPTLRRRLSLALWLTALSLLLAVPIWAQAVGDGLQDAENSGAGINLSLWRGLSTQPRDDAGDTWFNLGLYSSMHRLSGLGINVLGDVVRTDARGMDVSGLFHTVKGRMQGIQLSGLTNVGKDDIAGFSAAGLAVIGSSSLRGVALSGLLTVGGDDSRGLTMAGLINITGDRSHGLQLSGMANITADDWRGAQIGGLSNVSSGAVKGWQVSSLGNIVGDTLRGWQLATLLNVAGMDANGLQTGAVNIVGEGLRGAQLGLVNAAKRAEGLQTGLVNLAREAHGLQIGLVNRYTETLNGLQLGLVNLSPQTRIQLIAFGGNLSKVNLGLRIKNNKLYTLLGLGSHYLDLDKKPSMAFFYRAGTLWPIYKGVSAGGDIGYQHIETLHNHRHGLPARLYALQGRANLECRVTSAFGLFVSVGYGITRYYNQDRTYDRGMIVEGGIVVLRY